MISQELIQKIKFNVLLEYFKNRTYSYFERSYYFLEYIWVYSFHQYFETAKFQRFEMAKKLLQEQGHIDEQLNLK
jgi:hypothetical protein